MSSQLTLLANVQDLPSVRRYLFPDNIQSTPEPEDNDDWVQDECWGWEVEGEASRTQEDKGGDTYADDHNWFQEAIFSLSPTNDLIAIANEDKIVFLSQKWDPDGKSGLDTKFMKTWQASLRQDEGEMITAIMCISLASQKRSAHGGPDCTCVCVGFSSGYVRVYTENGSQLMSHLLHQDPVEKLKCRTYEAPRYLGVAEQHDEVLVLYRRVLVSIDGFSFVQSLRACRNQVARAVASGNEGGLEPPPLTYKKWNLQDQLSIHDQVSCGVYTPNPFDQMKTECVLKGFRASIKPTPPAAAVYMTTGVDPYLGFYHAVEGSAPLILTDMAYAMASKLKSAIKSAARYWFVPTVPEKEKDIRPKVEPAEPLKSRFGLTDLRRHGQTIALSPNNNYCAVTDSYGRVLLINIERGVAIQMWKGYRDAQVGWVSSREDSHHSRDVQHGQSPGRVAQFLIIYAPRRGILEIWAAENGPRVAAFNVNKHCRLIYPSYGMMGLNNATIKGVRNKAFHCVLVDPNGTIKTVDVPFHLALSVKNSKRARDLHLLKKLRELFKENSQESDALNAEATSILLDMKIASIAQQGIERVLSTKYLSCDSMLTLITATIQHLVMKKKDSIDVESRLLLHFCQQQEALLHTYHGLLRLNSTLQEQAECDEEHVTQILSLGREEVDNISQRLSVYQSCAMDDSFEPQRARVHFETDGTLSVVAFLSCFYCHLYRNSPDESREKTATVTLCNGLSDDKQLALAHFMYGTSLLGKCSVVQLNAVLQESGFLPNQLRDLLLVSWLSEDRTLNNVRYLHAILKSITATIDTSEVIVDSGSVSPWWQKVRDECSQSENSSASFLAALVGRSIAMEIISNQSKAKDPDADTSSDMMDTSDWESICLDIEQWKTLIMQLEDMLCLSGFLQIVPRPESPARLSRLEYGTPIVVSVSKLLECGKGAVPELVARHISQCGYPASVLIQMNRLSRANSTSESSHSEQVDVSHGGGHSNSIEHKLMTHLDTLRTSFPYSLDLDVLAANCCWENAVLWNKNIEHTECLCRALDYARLVQNAVLREGMCSMMWHMLVCKRLAVASRRMERKYKEDANRKDRNGGKKSNTSGSSRKIQTLGVSSHPGDLDKSQVIDRLDDRDSWKAANSDDSNISDSTLTRFAKQVCDLLSILMDANCEVNDKPVFSIEPQWQQGTGSAASLVELATEQKRTNYGLLRHHYHLCIILRAVLEFDLKSIRVLNLFDGKGKRAFFKELHSHPLLPTANVDAIVSSNRLQFLLLVLKHDVLNLDSSNPHRHSIGSSNSLSSLPNSPLLLPSTSSSPSSCVSAKSCWLDLVLQLAKEFELDVDRVKQHHVSELYSSGYDRRAEEVLSTVIDHELMGHQLLTIAGQRVSYYIHDKHLLDSLNTLSATSPTLSTWLKYQEADQLRKADVPLSDTGILLGHVISELTEGHSQYDMAISLVELVQSLMIQNEASIR